MNLEWAPAVMRVVSRLMWKSTTQLPVASFSDVIHPQQQRRRDRETECLRDLQVVVNCSHRGSAASPNRTRGDHSVPNVKIDFYRVALPDDYDGDFEALLQ